MPGERRERRRRRGARSLLRVWRERLRWAWFYVLALALVAAITLWVLRNQ